MASGLALQMLASSLAGLDNLPELALGLEPARVQSPDLQSPVSFSFNKSQECLAPV